MSFIGALSRFARYRGYGALYRMRKNIQVSHDPAFWALYEEVTRSRRLTMNLPELYNLYRLVPQVAALEGDIAEVGVYRGASARVICAVKGDKPLHLFDTFEGLPGVAAADYTDDRTAFSPGGRRDLALHQGKFSAGFQDVQSYLAGFENVRWYRGVFPATAEPVRDRRFCFVHLDVDTYQSTRDGLSFFYPRLSAGGMLVSHDYATVSCPGVHQAFDEFLQAHPQPVIELWDTQALLIKR
jgi:O-methyltransferase